MENTSNRLYFVDYLRVMLVILVIAHHAAQPYGPTGGAWPILDPANTMFLEPFFAVNAMFFMGLLFLISGYFTARSVEKKSDRVFLKGRFMRLGMPLIFIVVAVFGPFSYISSDSNLSFIEFFFKVYLGQWQLEFGHLWFIAHLLVYSLIYVIWNRYSHKNDKKKNTNVLLSNKLIISYVFILTLVTALVRIKFPIDTWIRILIPIEVAHFPQYFSLFLIGTFGYKNDWFNNIPDKIGRTWLQIGLITVVLRYLIGWRDVIGINFTKLIPTFLLNSEVFWITWESLVCVGLSIGLLYFLKKRFNHKNKFMLMLNSNAFTCYIIHIFIVLMVQGMIVEFQIHGLFKFITVTILSTILSFALSALLRKSSFLLSH